MFPDRLKGKKKRTARDCSELIGPTRCEDANVSYYHGDASEECHPRPHYRG